MKIIKTKQVKKIYHEKIRWYYKHKKVNKTHNHKLICKNCQYPGVYLIVRTSKNRVWELRKPGTTGYFRHKMLK